MKLSQNSYTHPIGTSHYADGEIPDQRNPRPSISDETPYAQPEVEVKEIAKGVKITDNRKKSLCERIAEEKSIPGVSEWFERNKGVIGLIGIAYIAFRIVTRRKPA